jgi:hypothetical protein
VSPTAKKPSVPFVPADWRAPERNLLPLFAGLLVTLVSVRAARSRRWWRVAALPAVGSLALSIIGRPAVLGWLAGTLPPWLAASSTLWVAPPGWANPYWLNGC